MTAIELKTYLVNRILEINDETFLKAIKTILDSKSQSEKLILTPEQRFEIAESKKQIEQGLFLNQEEMDHEFDKWQSEK
ncbi:hypothetical protein [Algoriphagus antarcticus]|uniref:Addiction module component n=1 Tax=Algoriphagus antarcticus TaxID=238540 RepID=A0A3E0E007_9BACT|nr:hypothetical protein [Algoriphagus antarcticus]REG90960.1 hypothetical protein C8N25_10568 [Algoriphagus antarcticus]